MDGCVDRCGGCKFYHYGECHGLPPKVEFLARTCKHISTRPRVEEHEYACGLFKERREKL